MQHDVTKALILTTVNDNPSNDQKIDPDLVAALYTEYADDLRSLLVGILRDYDLANEALQATFAKALDVGHTAQQETIKGWLFRVGYHEAIAIRRTQQRQNKSLQKFAWNQTLPDERPEDHANRTETAQQIRLAVQQLSEEQQRIVHLRIYEGKTFAAIAEEMGSPLGTVLTRMRLALRKLHVIMQTE